MQSTLLRTGITVLNFGLLWDVEPQIELRIDAIQIHVPGVLSAENLLRERHRLGAEVLVRERHYPKKVLAC